MENSTILVLVGTDVMLDGLTRRLDAIRSIPARAAVLVVGEMPPFPYYAAGFPPFAAVGVSPDWQEQVAETQNALKAKADEIEALLQRHDVSGEVSAAVSDSSQLADTVARHAMTCDLAMVSDELREPETLFREVVHGILFQSPAGILLNDPGAQALCAPRRIFIAWTSDRHTARAVHQALPLLRQADEVMIATIDAVTSELGEGEDPGVDLARWLTHHGCTVTVQQYPSGGKDIGACILDLSREAGADLIVMGSYSHSRARDAIFGSTTRTLIEQTEQAVFLAH